MLNMLNIHAKNTKSAMLTRQPRGALNLQLAGFLVLFNFEFLAAILCNPEDFTEIFRKFWRFL